MVHLTCSRLDIRFAIKMSAPVRLMLIVVAPL